MSITYGFYSSLDHDRTYTAEQFGSIFDGIIQDGVYASVGDHFEVRAHIPTPDMSVSVGTGRAWFHHTWTLSDEPISLTLANAHALLDRVDAIVLEVNTNMDVRANTIKVVTGTPATNPSDPSMIRSNGVYQYPLAFIRVRAGATAITTANILTAVGTSKCPYVTGVLKTISSDSIVARWEAEWEQLLDNTLGEYETWFNGVRDMLDTDVAGNLANAINDLRDDALTFSTFSGENLNNLEGNTFVILSQEQAGAANLPMGAVVSWLIQLHNGNYRLQFCSRAIASDALNQGIFWRKSSTSTPSWTNWKEVAPLYKDVGDTTTPIYLNENGVPQEVDTSKFLVKKEWNSSWSSIFEITESGFWYLTKANATALGGDLPLEYAGFLISLVENENYMTLIWMPVSATSKSESFYVKHWYNGSSSDWRKYTGISV